MIQHISEYRKSSSKSAISFKKIISGLFIATLIAMLWSYQAGYDQSIDWEVTTSAEVVQFPAMTIEGELLDHTINGDKYVLQERYSGTKIERNLGADQLFLGIIWLGLCLLISISTYFNRYIFFTVIAAFALMVNRLNLYEVGLFGIQSKMVMLIPFIAIVLPAIYFHEYKKSIPLHFRFIVLFIVSAVLVFGIQDPLQFTNHFLAHSIFPISLIVLLFLFTVSEEIIYGMLHVVTLSKGGKSNHLHFIILSLIFLGNLVLYYLNKYQIFENSFFFFDPYILLLVTTLVAWWSLKFKDKLLESYMPSGFLTLTFLSLGIITFAFLSLQMSKGMDAVYQSIHYFILYFHIGFGVLFFLYIIANFIDPLIKGLEVYKIAYRERNFPYVTARLGGLVCVAAFYFFSGQEPYNLLRSGYFNYLSENEKSLGNELLSKEYLIQAGFLGYNTHYPNYQLAWKEWDSGKEFGAKTNFFNATQRFPSPYAWINFGNIESETNPNLVQATYEETLRRKDSPEMKNNLGLIHYNKEEIDKALEYFETIEASDKWNQAPLVNKWSVYQKLDSLDSSFVVQDYDNGNFGVKSNILSIINDGSNLSFEMDLLDSARMLHRQAYLLNASYLFDHDSVANYMWREIDQTVLASRSNRLSKALAIHLYQKGDVNNAFRILDNIQQNSNDYVKGEYLDMLGKFALDQCAFKLANEYFNKALKVKYEASRVSKLEALAALDQKESFKKELLMIVKRDPGLTNMANDLLDQLVEYTPSAKTFPTYQLDSMSSEKMVILGERNPFNEQLIIQIVDMLDERKASGGYELLVNSLEVNPYSIVLIKAYVDAALNWNLVEYADQSVEKLGSLMEANRFEQYRSEYLAKKEELNSEDW